MKQLAKKTIRSSILKSFVRFLRRGILDFKQTQVFLRENGFVFLRKHYYLPIPEAGELAYEKPSHLVGIDMRPAAQLDFLRSTVAAYVAEIKDLPLNDAAAPFHWVNGTFMAGDADVYYALIRDRKPRRVFEIGSGNSSAIADLAITRNKAEDAAYACEFVCIEPFPPPALDRLANLTRLEKKPVQEVPLEFFAELRAGDILFIDSTHALKSGGDVWWEFCEILPRLAPGVHVHVHDISLPKPYPRVYFEADLFWNEQYVLQAYLTHNARAEVVWAGTYMLETHPADVKAAFAHAYDAMREKFPLAEPSSFWFRTR